MPKQPSDYGETEIKELCDDSVKLLTKAYSEMGIPGRNEMSPYQVKQLRKDTACEILYDALRLIEELSGVLCQDLKAASNSVKNQMLESQQTIIKLQSELLVSKNEQLETLQKSVKSSVGESVKTELKSYRAALTSNCPEPQIQKSANSEMIKEVVKSVVQEEDRSKNLMIFGLPEQENEELSNAVSEVLLAIGEKPRVEACRVGKENSAKTMRPVKVTAASSTIVNQILAKSRNLRLSEKFKTVFVSPDRSVEQRAKQRELVLDMKKLAADQPNKKYFIRNGVIISSDKTG